MPLPSGRRVEIVAAVASNGAIGLNGRMPWVLPPDLRRFSMLTAGHTVVMGRKTWESIGRPLLRRENIVVSRTPAFFADGAKIAGSLSAAIDAATWPDPVFVIGGEQPYREALPIAAVLHITELSKPFQGDVFFPFIDPALWSEAARERNECRGEGEFVFDFVTYERRESAAKTVSKEQTF